MKYFSAFTLFFVSFLALAQNATGQAVVWEDVPAWVDQLEIPKMPQARANQIGDGVFYAVNDLHLRWQGDTRLTYSRFAKEIITFGGVAEAATITRKYNPNNESISLLAIDIIRDGSRISLRDQLEPQIFRRETQLGSGIINGELTVYMDVPDLRVGDVIDVQVLYRTKPIVGDRNYQFLRTMDWSAPEGISRVTVDWQKGRPFYENVTARGLTRTVQELDNVTRYRWQRRDGDPVFSEKDVPDDRLVWGNLEFNDSADWAPVVNSLLAYYQQEYPVPAGFAAEIAALRLSGKPDREKALRALILVQDKIRYVGNEVGQGGFFARNPNLVATRRYGDCKDSAVLLKTLLNALNIPADVALVDNEAGKYLPDLLPSLYAFNHMILRVNLKDGPLWVDPTRDFQGGVIAGYTPPNYHFALPIAKGVTALQAMAVAAETVHNRDVTERYFFGASSLHLDVNTKAAGLEANWYRRNQATTNKSKYARQLEAYYGKQYPGLHRDKELDFKDNRPLNTFEMQESYVLGYDDLFGERLVSNFGFRPDGFSAFYEPLQEFSRQYPLKVRHPYHYIHRINLKNTPLDLEPPKALRINTPVFSFSFTAGGQGKTLWMRWELITHADVVLPDQYAQWREDVAKLQDNVYWQWDLTPPETEPTSLGFLGLLQKAYGAAQDDNSGVSQ